MRNLLSIIFVSLLLSGNAFADNSFETSFKKALEDHQYYFKYKETTYTTDMEGEPFDFFKHGYKTYREAAEYKLKNYPNDKSFSCFVFKGKLWQMYGLSRDPSKRNSLEYDINGWKKSTLVESNNKKIKLVLHESNGCYRPNSYFKILYDDKEAYDSRTDFYDDREHLKGKDINLNINYYIDKDYNNNGKQELFLDVGYAFGMPWIESYYFFEYDNDSIKLMKKIVASKREERLSISDYHHSVGYLSKPKFEISEEELAKIIVEKFR